MIQVPIKDSRFGSENLRVGVTECCTSRVHIGHCLSDSPTGDKVLMHWVLIRVLVLNLVN